MPMTGGGVSGSASLAHRQEKKAWVGSAVYVGTNASATALTSATDWSLSKTVVGTGSYVQTRAADSWDNYLTATYT